MTTSSSAAQTHTVLTNKDTGSLHVGTAGAHLQVGDQVTCLGRTLTVTYTMGKGEKCHLCFGGQKMAFPIGVDIDWQLGAHSTPVAPIQAKIQESITDKKARLMAELAATETELETMYS